MTADSHIEEFDGLQALVIERFDRKAPSAGPPYPPHRRHMEDFCSAWGLDVYDQSVKYNQKANSLQRVAATLRTFSVDPPGDLQRLTDMLCTNVVIGNADAHGRNYSALIDPHGGAHLAPAYDLVSTVQCPGVDGKVAMTIGGSCAFGR